MARVIAARAAECPDRAAFVGRDGEVSYAQLAAEVDRVASMLPGMPGWPAQGVPRVGVQCPDGVRHAVLMLAVMKAGGCAVPIAGELTEGERSVLVRTTALHGILSACRDVAPRDPRTAVALIDGVRWESLPEVEPCFPVVDFEKLSPAFIRFSSGTTGTSKGVVLSHATLH